MFNSSTIVALAGNVLALQAGWGKKCVIFRLKTNVSNTKTTLN